MIQIQQVLSTSKEVGCAMSAFDVAPWHLAIKPPTVRAIAVKAPSPNLGLPRPGIQYDCPARKDHRCICITSTTPTRPPSPSCGM